MQINRNNYEEYFLLYIDGELNRADKAAVEAFVQLHPDLEEELSLLQETSVMPLDVSVEMPGKELLIRQDEWQEADLTELREDLMSFIDDELPETRRLELEKQIAGDIILKSELSSLEKTKLVAEAVTIPAKDTLYRYETDRKPIPIRWTRWVAAAAAVAGIAWVSLNLISNNHTDSVGPEVAVVNQTNEPAATEPSTSGSPKVAVVAQKDDEQKQQQTSVKENATVQYAAIHQPDEKKADEKIYQTAASTEPVKKLPPDVRDRTENVPHDLAVIVPASGIKKGKQAEESKIGAPEVNSNIYVAVVNENEPSTPPNRETSPYQYASYDEYAQVDDDYVNIAGARISKQKLRGVFRNVSRTVSRTFEKSSVTNVSSL